MSWGTSKAAGEKCMRMKMKPNISPASQASKLARSGSLKERRQFTTAIISFQRRNFFSLFIKQAGFYLPQRREVLMYIHLTEHARSLEGLLAMRGFSISLQQRTKENRLVGKCCHCSIANGS